MTALSEPTVSPLCSSVPAEEGADPGSIELVAQQVLNISLPSSPEQTRKLQREIQESISQLKGVDAVVNSTREGLTLAQELLAQGKEARQVVGACWGRQGIGSVPLHWQGLELPVLLQGASRRHKG